MHLGVELDKRARKLRSRRRRPAEELLDAGRIALQGKVEVVGRAVLRVILTSGWGAVVRLRALLTPEGAG